MNFNVRTGNGGTTQSNPWERLRLDVNLTRRFFLSGTFENFHGDTMNFVRGFGVEVLAGNL